MAQLAQQASATGRRQFLGYPRWHRTGPTRWLPSWRGGLGPHVALGGPGVGGGVAADAGTNTPPAGGFPRGPTPHRYLPRGATG